MSDYGIAVATGWTALRAVIAALIAVSAAGLLVFEIRRTSTYQRRWYWGLLLISILSPDLVAGYGYANFSLSLARHPVWNELGVTLLIALKATAVAAVMLYFTPEPALSPSGRHLLNLGSTRVSTWNRAKLLCLHGPPVRALPAFAIAFLFAFQQFEIPSLTGAIAWTVTLFDRQALLPDLAASADPLVWPLMVGLLALAPPLVFVIRSVAPKRRSVAPWSVSRAGRVAALLIAVFLAVGTAFVPFGILLREGVTGFGSLASAAPNIVAFWQEIGIAAGYGASAALVAYFAAVAVLRLVATSTWKVFGIVLLVLASVPGLCGPLVPSLAAVELLQHAPWLTFRDTLIPLIVVLALSLLPRAILLEALSNFSRDDAAIHLARQLRRSEISQQRRSARRLLWSLDGFGKFCRISLLAYWGYLDLTVATILSPPGVVPVTARLYNLMHYGQNATLSAMTLVAIGVPVLGFFAVLLLRRLVVNVVAR